MGFISKNMLDRWNEFDCNPKEKQRMSKQNCCCISNEEASEILNKVRSENMIRRKDIINKLKMWLVDLESEPNTGDYREICENRGAREAIECSIAEIESIPSVWHDASKELPTCNLSCLIAYQEIDICTGEYSKTVHFLLCDYLPEYKHWNIKEPINVLKWMYLPDYEEVIKCL